MRIWEPVETALKNPQSHSRPIYYVGGTLCVDLARGFVALNLDGSGFTRAGKIIQPAHILKLVRDIYFRIKGCIRKNGKYTTMQEDFDNALIQ